MDILKNAWSPAWTLQSVCRAIASLLAHAEPDSPLARPPGPGGPPPPSPPPLLLSRQRAAQRSAAPDRPSRGSAPQNCDAGNLLRAGDVRGYNSLARCYTTELASLPKAQLVAQLQARQQHRR